MVLKHWILAILTVVGFWGAAKPTSVYSRPIAAPQVIRFRVIANSDNPVDQAIKLDVRDRVLVTMDSALNGVKNRTVAARRIDAMTGELSRVANRVLKAHHVSYRARVAWTRTVFPTKAYGSWVLPAGRYQALLITLGSGQGHNWWCVLYPSLCFVDMGNALAVPAPSVPVTTPPVVRPIVPRHRRRMTKAPRMVGRGRIRVSWTTPRFIATFLAILREV